jgi:hypothetical protein
MDDFCIDWYEIDTHFFVHANAYPDVELADQPGFMLRWEPILEGQRRHCSGKVMVCGHTSQRSGVPLNTEHAVCIDTWVYGKGWLTGLDVRTGKLWQANQQGETAPGWLDARRSCDEHRPSASYRIAVALVVHVFLGSLLLATLTVSGPRLIRSSATQHETARAHRTCRVGLAALLPLPPRRDCRFFLFLAVDGA